MPMKNSRVYFTLYTLGFVTLSPTYAQDTYTLHQALQRVVDTHPLLHSAELQIERSKLESNRVESQLGFQTNGQAGYNHDVSLFGAPSDRIEGAANLERGLANGGRIGASANYIYENNDFSFSPLLPNPSHTVKFDVNYRLPILKGAGNPNYNQGLIAARLGVNTATTSRASLRDQLARQALDLYFALSGTLARLENTHQAIDRAKRLKVYIQRNVELGLLEEKDILQVEAQLRAQTADQQAFTVIKTQQRIALNRLMGLPSDAPVNTHLDEDDKRDEALSDNAVMLEVEKNNPDLLRLDARINLAETVIARNRDAKNDQFDVVVTGGVRSKNGDSTLGTVNEQDWAGGVRVEYRRAIDKRGVDAELAQAILDRSIAIQDLQATKSDLHYTVSSLLAELRAARSALDAVRLRLNSEKQKLEEAEKRYRTGRADTTQLIQFESDLYFTQFAVEQQRIELARRSAILELLRGKIWDAVIPAVSDSRGNKQ
ncbi:MAG: TolC family protein [Gammaproteobacteria bacterium]|nr:TolC family protein [Gammaproteobacteria bacterium]